ncbi:hypothetical protein ABZV67_43090 [Streptomyces sp. NPDC005065]|uniref:hypothetical protein n=1 Tax=Streptomyces sp. NPDC005065 TaxID=3154461 RepID=UPI0033BC9E82
MTPYITTREGELAESPMTLRVTIDLFGYSTLDYTGERPGDRDAYRGDAALTECRVARRAGDWAAPLGSTRCG